MSDFDSLPSWVQPKVKAMLEEERKAAILWIRDRIRRDFAHRMEGTIGRDWLDQKLSNDWLILGSEVTPASAPEKEPDLATCKHGRYSATQFCGNCWGEAGHPAPLPPVAGEEKGPPASMWLAPLLHGWACQIAARFNSPVWLVGSALREAKPRDVDVIVTLPDEQFRARYGCSGLGTQMIGDVRDEEPHTRYWQDMAKLTGWADFHHGNKSLNLDFKVQDESQVRARGHGRMLRVRLDTLEVPSIAEIPSPLEIGYIDAEHHYLAPSPPNAEQGEDVSDLGHYMRACSRLTDEKAALLVCREVVRQVIAQMETGTLHNESLYGWRLALELADKVVPR